jgi:hypothetical protein
MRRGASYTKMSWPGLSEAYGHGEMEVSVVSIHPVARAPQHTYYLSEGHCCNINTSSSLWSACVATARPATH